MYQFYTVEITKTNSGELSHDIKWHYDEDATKAQRKAEPEEEPEEERTECNK